MQIADNATLGHKEKMSICESTRFENKVTLTINSQFIACTSQWTKLRVVNIGLCVGVTPVAASLKLNLTLTPQG